MSHLLFYIARDLVKIAGIVLLALALVAGLAVGLFYLVVTGVAYVHLVYGG